LIILKTILQIYYIDNMNLFILSLVPQEIAMYMMDKHICKILLEAVQVLCTVKRIIDLEDDDDNILYKLTHKNHPITLWCKTSRENFIWTLDLVEELHKEWKFRYNHSDTRKHKSFVVAEYLRNRTPDECKFKEKGLTQFAFVMPEQYKTDDIVESYRNYYMSEDKKKIATWNKTREKPDWYAF
jgi:hypothetical protein